MRACAIFCVQLRPHIYVWIYVKVHLRQVAVVAQLDASVFQIVVSEEASINMLAKKFAQLENELILQHLQFDLSSVQVLDDYIHELLFLLLGRWRIRCCPCIFCVRFLLFILLFCRLVLLRLLGLLTLWNCLLLSLIFCRLNWSLCCWCFSTSRSLGGLSFCSLVLLFLSVVLLSTHDFNKCQQ